jgi:hypothetical protein
MWTMNRMTAAAVFLAGLALATTSTTATAAARAETRAAGADVCITVDEAHDMLSPQDRRAALLLLARQFELAGEHVAPEGCPIPYTVSHVRLGDTIVVTLSGQNGQREGTALGLDDLPALYSQMVRSIVTGRPMTGFNVVDRTNVTEAQEASGKRAQSDSFGYARLGYGSVFGDRNYGGPTLGFGYRAELDSFGIDVSFLNSQVPSSGSGSAYASSEASMSGSLLKLEALYFMKPKANATIYLGGGASYGFASFGGSDYNSSTYRSSWHGSGLQGELTAGYEWPRASTLRMFVQADATLPFYNVTSETITYSRSGPTGLTATEHRYSPSLAVSVGVGWHRNRGGR